MWHNEFSTDYQKKKKKFAGKNSRAITLENKILFLLEKEKKPFRLWG